MHKEDGQMQLTHICGPMPLELQMIVEIMHQQTKMTPVPCQDFVLTVVYQQSRTNIILDAQLMH